MEERRLIGYNEPRLIGYDAPRARLMCFDKLVFILALPDGVYEAFASEEEARLTCAARGIEVADGVDLVEFGVDPVEFSPGRRQFYF